MLGQDQEMMVSKVSHIYFYFKFTRAVYLMQFSAPGGGLFLCDQAQVYSGPSRR